MCGDPRKVFSRKIHHQSSSPPPTRNPEALGSPSVAASAAPSAARASIRPRRLPAASPILPPPVEKILSARSRFEEFYRPLVKTDTPLGSIYRIYVAVLCGRHLVLRNEIEHFWNKHNWNVHDIPLPNVPDRAQLAVLAGITYVLARAFNHLIDRGMPRCAPAVISDEMMKELNSRLKVHETVPEWAGSVQLEKTLVIPDASGRSPTKASLDDLDGEMFKKNVLVHKLPAQFV
jgi:hypothetical protein